MQNCRCRSRSCRLLCRLGERPLEPSGGGRQVLRRRQAVGLAGKLEAGRFPRLVPCRCGCSVLYVVLNTRGTSRLANSCAWRSHIRPSRPTDVGGTACALERRPSSPGLWVGKRSLSDLSQPRHAVCRTAQLLCLSVFHGSFELEHGSKGPFLSLVINSLQQPIGYHGALIDPWLKLFRRSAECSQMIKDTLNVEEFLGTSDKKLV